MTAWTGLWAGYAVLTLAVYGRAWHYPFLLDDVFHFLGNPTVHSWKGLWPVWTTNYWESAGEGGLYRPLLKTLWMAEIALLGGGKGALLLVSAGLHALNATLIAWLARRAGTGLAIALAAGLWFALHPGHGEVLLTAVGQGEIVSLALGLGAFALVFPNGTGWTAARLSGCVGLLLAGLFVKEQVYAWVPLCALALALNPGFSRRMKAAALAGIAAAVVTAIAVRLSVLGGLGPEGVYQLGGELGWSQRGALAFYLFGRYTLLALAPIRLSPDYSWIALLLPLKWIDPLVAWGAAAALGAIAWIAWAAGAGKRAGLLFGLAALLPLAPFLGLRAIGTLFAERHAYHALAGAALLVALAAAWIVARRPGCISGFYQASLMQGNGRRTAESAGQARFSDPQREAVRTPGARKSAKSRRPVPVFPALFAVEFGYAPRRPDPHGLRWRVAAGLIALWALVLGARTAWNVPAWQSGWRLWEATLRECPKSFFAAANLAYYQMAAGRFPEARANAERALRIDPGFADAHMTLGELDLVEGRPESARRHFAQAEDHPTFGFRARVGMALADLRLGRVAEARKAYESLAVDRPGDPLLARLAAEMGRAP